MAILFSPDGGITDILRRSKTGDIMLSGGDISVTRGAAPDRRRGTTPGAVSGIPPGQRANTRQRFMRPPKADPGRQPWLLNSDSPSSRGSPLSRGRGGIEALREQPSNLKDVHPPEFNLSDAKEAAEAIGITQPRVTSEQGGNTPEEPQEDMMSGLYKFMADEDNSAMLLDLGLRMMANTNPDFLGGLGEAGLGTIQATAARKGARAEGQIAAMNAASQAKIAEAQMLNAQKNPVTAVEAGEKGLAIVRADGTVNEVPVSKEVVDLAVKDPVMEAVIKAMGPEIALATEEEIPAISNKMLYMYNIFKEADSDRSGVRDPDGILERTIPLEEE